MLLNARNAGSAAYTASGLKKNAPSVDLGENGTIQVIAADSVFDHGMKTIYSLTTGMPACQATGARHPGTAADSNIVFASGTRVLAQPY